MFNVDITREILDIRTKEKIKKRQKKKQKKNMFLCSSV